MIIDVHPDAEAEVIASALRLEQRERGLGREFIDEYEFALTRIEAQPRLYGLAEDAPPNLEARQYLSKRFKFRIVYLMHGNDVFVMAVSHIHRRPGHWKRRIPR